MNKSELISFCISDNRVCPLPPQWVKFEELLSKMGNSKPPQSLILGYWFDTSDEEKRKCVQQQIDWADERGLLDFAIDYLSRLKLSQWHIGYRK